MYRFLSFCLVIMVLAGSGCSSNQTMKDSWKYTKRQYRTYLNTPAEIDMDATGDCENYEIALGEAVLDVDAELSRFIRAMENSDRSPDQAWVMQVTSQFPWLSGVALADKDGNPVARYPEGFMKEFDVKPLLEVDPKQRITALRAYVNKSPLGPEIYVAAPVYTNEDMRGLVVAHFDPRNLITSRTSQPNTFVMASAAGILWAGGFGEGSPVSQEKWEDTLKNRSCGIIGASGSRFFWTTRYIGNLPIVYAIPTDAGKDVKQKADAVIKAESETLLRAPLPNTPADTTPKPQSLGE